jgi:hypothetical protein
VPRRGDRAAPPARAGEWTIIFADNAAASGWEDLFTAAPGNTLRAWEHLSRDPRNRRANPGRVGPLQHELGKRKIAGRELEQWQYEVTAGGRIWYCPDDEQKVVHLTYASTRHPKQTD